MIFAIAVGGSYLRIVRSQNFISHLNQWLAIQVCVPFRAALRRATNESFVLYLISAFLCALRAFFRSRLDTSLEVLALRQQIAVLKRQRPRPPLTRFDRFLLDHAEAGLAAMVRRSGHREARKL